LFGDTAIALKYFDNQTLVESKITAVEKSATEVQCSERKLHETVHKVKAQFDHFQKSVESLLKEHRTTLTEITTVNNTNPGTRESAQTNDSLSQLTSNLGISFNLQQCGLQALQIRELLLKYVLS